MKTISTLAAALLISASDPFDGSNDADADEAIGICIHCDADCCEVRKLDPNPIRRSDL